MIMTIYKRALAVLMKKPIKLWGISLLATFLIPVLTGLCGVAIPGLGLAISLLLSTSMLMVYLHGYRGEDVQVLQLFDCFKDWATVKRVVLGLAWMYLWVALWGLIPIAGPVFAIIRMYEYRLTPYILITEPDVALTDAIKISKERTNGYKGKMFGADILAAVAIMVAFLILGLLSAIPVVGVLFGIITFLAYIAVLALLPLFMGLVQAAFYEEITNPTVPQAPVYNAIPQAPVYAVPAPQAPVNNAAPQAPKAFCPECGAAYPSEAARFCIGCGKPRA